MPNKGANRVWPESAVGRTMSRNSFNKKPPEYAPNPVDTDHVVLTPEIEALTEQLARNTHDVWARQRLSEGWTYGPQRHDSKKEHPSLVPYEELSESEKQYDRNTALETLKLITALGYEVIKV